MGAEQFSTRAHGKTAQEAFDNARNEAWYDHGHAGYTGTIAEKPGFVMAMQGVVRYADRLAVDIADERTDLWANGKRLPGDARDRLVEAYNDKWGPALCIQTGPEEFLFFGIASS